MNTKQNRPKDKEYNQKQTGTFYNDKDGQYINKHNNPKSTYIK